MKKAPIKLKMYKETSLRELAEKAGYFGDDPGLIMHYALPFLWGTKEETKWKYFENLEKEGLLSHDELWLFNQLKQYRAGFQKGADITKAKAERNLKIFQGIVDKYDIPLPMSPALLFKTIKQEWPKETKLPNKKTLDCYQKKILAKKRKG